jgi:hypothetical protein
LDLPAGACCPWSASGKVVASRSRVKIRPHPTHRRAT